MFYTDRPHLKPRALAAVTFAAALILSPACSFKEPISASESLYGCVIGVPELSEGKDNQGRVVLPVRVDDLGQKRISAQGPEAFRIKKEFGPADRIRLLFKRIDISLTVTGRTQKERELRNQLFQTMNRSREYVVMDTPEAVTQIVLVDRTSKECTG